MNIFSRPTSKHLKVAVAFSCSLVLGACATTPVGKVSDASATPIIMDELNISLMAAVILQGFEEIKERAYHDPDINILFAASLEELRRIDTDISFEVEDGFVFMDVRNTDGNGSEKITRTQVSEAPNGDLTQWSLTTINAILAAREKSERFRDADDEVLYEALFDGAVAKLDAFSRYDSRREAALSRLIRDGVIGLGVRVVTAEGGAIVQSIMVNGPAEKAGLKIDDLIIAADDVSLNDKTLAEIRRRLEGRAEGSVDLTIRRIGEPDDLVFRVERELIVADTVTSRVVDGIAELRIQSFNQRTAFAVEHAFRAAKADAGGMLKGVILDMRGDPGGLLDQAVAVADRFLDEGLISKLRGRHPGANQSYDAHMGDITNGLPIVVVVDGRAASAAEIVAAALQDNNRALVIGTVTLGKGSVQTIVRLHNSGELAVTWSRAAAPSGIGLHGLGVLPDICLSGETSPANVVISKMVEKPNPMVSARAQWLNPPQGSDMKMAILRNECLAETRVGRPLDLQVARRILSDPKLFAVAAAKSGSQIAVMP